MNQKIPTRRSLFCRAWRFAERSWWGVIFVWIILSPILIVINLAGQP